MVTLTTLSAEIQTALNSPNFLVTLTTLIVEIQTAVNSPNFFTLLACVIYNIKWKQQECDLQRQSLQIDSVLPFSMNDAPVRKKFGIKYGQLMIRFCMKCDPLTKRLYKLWHLMV